VSAAAAAGFDACSGGRDFSEIFDGDAGNRRVFSASMAEAERQYEAVLAAGRDADVVVGAALQFGAPLAAAELGIPYRYAVFSPMYLRSVQLPTFSPGARHAHPLLHRTRWAIEDFVARRGAAWLAAKHRALRLQPPRSMHRYLLGAGPALGAFDPVLAPPPSDGLPVAVTGLWRSDTAAELDRHIQDFLHASAAPAYLGFGSMRLRRPAEAMQSAIRALIDSGRRVILARGWGEFAGHLSHERVLLIDEAPHDLLLPRVSVVIHHGGAGTTAAAARAGVPQLVLPHLGDQFYHGMRVHALALGPRAIPLRHLTVGKLLDALAQIDANGRLARHVASFAAAMREREGSAVAAELLEKRATG
jgi:UDP:flavonoid glycosyltransferase YjiC (YdhE family)